MFATLMNALSDAKAEIHDEGIEEVEGKQGRAFNVRFPDGYAYIMLVFVADFPRPLGATPNAE